VPAIFDNSPNWSLRVRILLRQELVCANTDPSSLGTECDLSAAIIDIEHSTEVDNETKTLDMPAINQPDDIMTVLLRSKLS
jgi:hypothetical protein